VTNLTSSLDSEPCGHRDAGLSWSWLCSQHSAQDGSWRNLKHLMPEGGRGDLAGQWECRLSGYCSQEQRGWDALGACQPAWPLLPWTVTNLAVFGPGASPPPTPGQWPGLMHLWGLARSWGRVSDVHDRCPGLCRYCLCVI
jgi:hypothetical protein